MKVLLAAVSAMALCAGLAACADFPQPAYPVSQPVYAPPETARAPEPPAPVPAPVADPDAPVARPTAPIGQSTLPPPAPRPAKPGAFLDRGLDIGRPPLALAVWRSDDEADVYPAARRHHKAAAKPAPKDEDAEAGTVKVGKGDTLASIARAHDSSIEALAKLNGLKSPYRLTAGQSLKLPAAAASDQAAAEPKASNSGKGKTAAADKSSAEKPAGAAEEVTVGKGDTLASISRKTGVSVDELAQLNGLPKPYRLQVGEVIRLKAEEQAASDKAPPKGSAKAKTVAKATPPEEEQAAATSTITVRRRDTIQSLARQAHVSVAELARLNHLKKPYRLKPGQHIELPDQIGAVASRSAPSRSESGRATAAADERPAGPTSVTAGRRDTLRSIAEKHGVPLETLAKLNHLKKPYRIRRGQKIKLPAAPAAEGRVQQRLTSDRPSAGTYRVQAGDTLYSIGRRFGADAKTLADLNGMSPDDRLTTGRLLRLPGGSEDKLAAPNRAVTSSEPPSRPVPYAGLPTNPPVPPAPGLAPPASSSATASSAPPVSPPPSNATPPATLGQAAPYRPTAPAPEPTTPGDAEVAAAGKGLFLWPVKGDVLQRFGPLTGGQRNDGVDISGAPGDPVVAAAAGEVVYAGNSVPGFGNLVLIRHDGGWVTAYAHLKSLDVKMRQTVTQGQAIGVVGQTGGVGQPQLHFEVRYAPSTRDKARPIDPMLVLPQIN
ncbi:MAG: LysM peptidoglycan-binding domain-containing protein [Caulobacteraceae bacterium]